MVIIIGFVAISLISVPILRYGFQHKTEPLSVEAKSEISTLIYIAIAILFYGIWGCVFQKIGALVAAIGFVVLSIAALFVFTGKFCKKEQSILMGRRKHSVSYVITTITYFILALVSLCLVVEKKYALWVIVFNLVDAFILWCINRKLFAEELES